MNQNHTLDNERNDDDEHSNDHVDTNDMKNFISCIKSKSNINDDKEDRQRPVRYLSRTVINSMTRGQLLELVKSMYSDRSDIYHMNSIQLLTLINKTIGHNGNYVQVVTKDYINDLNVTQLRIFCKELQLDTTHDVDRMNKPMLEILLKSYFKNNYPTSTNDDNDNENRSDDDDDDDDYRNDREEVEDSDINKNVNISSYNNEDIEEVDERTKSLKIDRRLLKMHQDNAKLVDKIDMLKNTIEDLQNRLLTAETTRDDILRRYSILENRENNRDDDDNRNSTTISNLQNLLNNANIAMTRSRINVADLTASLNERTKQLEDCLTRGREKDASIDKLNLKVTELEKLLQIQRDTHQDATLKISNIRMNDNNATRIQISSLNDELHRCQDQINRLTISNDDLRTKTYNLEQKLKFANERTVSLQLEKERVTQNNVELAQSLENVRAEMRNMSKTISKLNNEKQTLIEEHEENLRNLNAVISKLRSENEQLTDQHIDIEKSLQACRDTNTNLQVKLKLADSSNKISQESKNVLESKIEELHNELGNERKRSMNSRREYDELLVSYRELKTDLELAKSNYTNMELERNTFSSNMNVMKDELNEIRRKLELHEAEKRAEITKGSQKKSNSSSSENLEKDNAIKSLRSQLNSVKVVNEQLKFNIRELQNSHSITIKKLEQIHRDNLTSVEISFANNIEKYKSRIDELTRVNGELTKINATLSVAGPSASPLRKSGDDQRSYNRYTTNDINKLNRDRNQWLRELNIIRSENGELKRQIDSLNKLLEKSRNEIKQIRSKYNSLETQKDYENGDLFAGMEENLDAAMSRCKELFDEKLRLENDIQRLMEEGAMNREKIHRQNYDIEKLKNTIQENLDKQFDLINNGYRYDDDDDDNCSGGVAVLKSRITNLESQIIELSADIEYRDGNIASLEKERDDLKQKYNNEKRNSRNASDGVAKLKINMKKSELERDKFREKCLKSDNIIMELKRQLEINNVDLERIRDERNEYQEKVKFLDAEILTNRNKFEEQTNTLNNMLRQYSRRSINNSNPSLNDTRKLHMQLQLQIETLNNQLDTVKSERKIVLEEVIRLNHQIDTLKQNISMQRAKYDNNMTKLGKEFDSKLEYLINSHRDELKEYQDMLNNSEAKLIQSEKQYQQLLANNSSAATEMRALEKRLASEMNRYQEELSQKDAIISQLKSVIEPMQREIENLNTSRRNLQYNINNTTNDSELTTSSSSNNMLLYDKIKQLENELNRYKESERAWRNERDLLVSKMRNTVGANDLSLQSRIRTLEMDNKNLRENLQANNSTIANERANYIQQLDKLNEEIDMNNREMGKLQVEIASLNNQLNASNVLNESQIEKINRQNEELNSNLTEINALRDELNKRESDILVANRELNVLRRRVEKYKSSTTPSSEEKLTTPKRMQYVKTIKTLRKEIADNKRQIKNLIRDRSQNDDHVNQLRVNDQLLNVINSLKNQIRESNGEIKMYERKLYESNRQNVKLNDNMKRVVGENESLNNRIKSLYISNNNYDKQIAEIGEEVAKKNELIKILTLSVENIESNNEEVRGDGVNTTNFFKNLLVTTIRERNDLDRKVQELQSEVFINKSRLSECQATMVQLNNDLMMRVEENKNLERVIVELRERISNNESKLQELQLEDGGRMTRIPEYDDENIRNYRLRLQQAQNIIKNNQNELSRLKNVDNDLRELRKKLISQSGKEDNDKHMTQELQNAMTQLDYSKNIIEEHVEQIQQLTAKNEDTERALNELQSDMRALEVDRSNILTENASLNDELTSMKDDMDIMQRKFTQLQNDYYSTSRELELEKEERFKCNATNVEIKQELRTLKSEFLRLQKQCGGIKRCATKLQESIISGDEKLSSAPKTTTKRKRNNDDNTNDDYNNRKKVHLRKSTSRSPKRNLKRKEINNDNDASTSKNRRSSSSSSSSRTTITPPIPRSRSLRLSASSVKDLKIDSNRQRLLNAGIVQDTELTDEEYDENFDRNLLSYDDTEEDIMRKRILSNPKYEFLNNTYNG